ncbi:MAG: hypothetical protein M9941_19020 [Anaerolineae bacterium]|nr:hypothetical protein [Anaerolineae bacterium]
MHQFRRIRIDRRLFVWVGLIIAMLVILVPSWSARNDESLQIQLIVGDRRYDFVSWEIATLFNKAEAALIGTHHLLDGDAQQAVVLDYLDLVTERQWATYELELAYANSDALHIETALAEWERLRLQMEALQPLAEAVLEQQVSTILTEESFDVFGRTWPPVSATMTPLPTMLIISPRDEIRTLRSIPLKADLSIAEHEVVEQAIFEELGYAALVVPIGGLGIYPAMIQESANLNWLADVFAHEWAHHWLAFKPLGLQFLTPLSELGRGVRTMNETTASIVGGEIGRQVIERFYPALVPVAVENVEVEDSAEFEPPTFDFRAEMNITRQRVDELLAAGQIEEAETYMEQRRQLFVANGYNIRKLNQAYFAFYGAYADEPGASGGDPVGPLVVELRENSISLRDFMDTIGTITTFEQLQETVENK